MKYVTELGTTSKEDLDCEWMSFGKIITNSSDGLKDTDCVQDPTHVITKLRNCVIKPSKIRRYINTQCLYIL